MKNNKKKKAKNRYIPKDIKLELVKEAGDKCANPGCSNYLIEIHHIKEWHIYKTHDAKHMIAICPSCHDSVTRGGLKIDDETLYRWKVIKRGQHDSDHIYVEPLNPARLLMGSIALETKDELTVFELPNKNSLKLNTRDGDILLLDLVSSTLEGEPLVEVKSNYITYKRSENIVAKRYPGKFQLLLTGEARKFIPDWVIARHMLHNPSFFSFQEYKLLEIEVLKPGLAYINGIWLDNDTTFVISNIGISFIQPSRPEPITLRGKGEATILKWVGPVNQNLFSLLINDSV